MDNFLIALILSLVEGATEFLPVSSTGHLVLAGKLLGFEGDKEKTFEIVIQLGAILAVLWLYRFKVKEIAREAFSLNFKPGKLNIIHIFIGIIPALALGAVLHDKIKALMSPKPVLAALLVGSILLWAAEKFKTRSSVGLRALSEVSSIDQITYKQALGIGLFQCLSLWSGFSRAGATISGGLFMGLSRKIAAEFSFIIAIPLMFAASGYDLLKSWELFSVADIPFMAVGIVASFLAAWVSVVWFLKFLERTSLTAFAIYRVILAVVFWVVFIM